MAQSEQIMRLKEPIKLIISIAICQLAGIIGSFFTISQIPSWYAGLIKPSFNPPNWLFGPVWLTLYTLMGISLYLIWLKGFKTKQAKTALLLFATQLVLNSLWSIIFFGWHMTDYALAEIVLLWFVILAVIIRFYKISKPATYLLVPYILWVSFAAFLNLSIFLLN